MATHPADIAGLRCRSGRTLDDRLRPGPSAPPRTPATTAAAPRTAGSCTGRPQNGPASCSRPRPSAPRHVHGTGPLSCFARWCVHPHTGSGVLCTASRASRSCFAASISSNLRSCRWRNAVRALSTAHAKPPVQNRMRTNQNQFTLPPFPRYVDQHRSGPGCPVRRWQPLREPARAGSPPSGSGTV